MNSSSRGEDPELIITNSFDGLLSRMAALDHAGILMSGRKTLRNAKRQRVEPTKTMSEMIEMTEMTMEDIGFFVSLRLIECVEAGDDPVLSFRDVYGLVRIFSRFVAQGIIP